MELVEGPTLVERLRRPEGLRLPDDGSERPSGLPVDEALRIAIRRVGDRLEGEITLYDPEVLVRPVRARMRWELDKETRPELRPTYNTCTDTIGPSSKVFMDDRGIVNERLPGDPLYWDTTDPRPWRVCLNESDRRYEQYRKAQKR